MNTVNRRILVVDDDRDSAFAISVMLNEQGLVVDWFTDPKKALSLFKPGIFAVALLDAKMPDLDGYSLYQALTKLDPNLKICFLTALFESGYEGLRSHLPNIDSRYFMRKPIMLTDLVETVGSILAA